MLISLLWSPFGSFRPRSESIAIDFLLRYAYARDILGLVRPGQERDSKRRIHLTAELSNDGMREKQRSYNAE